MKVGILGAGMIVHDLLTFIHQVDGVELTAICALPEEKKKLKVWLRNIILLLHM